MNNKYKFINSEIVVPTNAKLIFEEVRYIENTLNQLLKDRARFRFRIQIRAMLIDLDSCVNSRDLLWGKRNKFDAKIKKLKDATEELEIKLREENGSI